MKHLFEGKYKNVILRPLAAGDTENLRNWRNDPVNSQFLRKIPYITKEMQSAWFQSYLDNPDELSFAILESSEKNRIVGSLSLYNFHRNTCFFGKILIGDKLAHGKKIGLNATICVLQIAFSQLDMECVYLKVFPDNIPALRVYQQAGFKLSDISRDENGLEEYTMMIQKRDLEAFSNA